MTKTMTQERLVEAQFGPQAAAYVTSAVHAQGDDLRQLAGIVRGAKQARVLDLGCGGGHVGFTVAPEVGQVVAYDLSADMLAAVGDEARRRGLANIACEQGGAENLSFADGAFDFVLCRFTAHHWRDVPMALREARRVLAPHGKAVFVDVVAPEAPVLDTFLQTFEMLRDPSHVRNYRVTEWTGMAEAAGFLVGPITRRRLPLEFTSWIARIKTPDVHAQAIRSLQARMSAAVTDHFEVQPDGSFTLDTMTLELTAA